MLAEFLFMSGRMAALFIHQWRGKRKEHVRAAGHSSLALRGSNARPRTQPTLRGRETGVTEATNVLNS